MYSTDKLKYTLIAFLLKIVYHALNIYKYIL